MKKEIGDSVKILFLDLETFPNIGYTWTKWETNVIDFIEHWYILCVGYKWLGGKTKVVALPDFKGYKPHSKDEELVKFAWGLLDEADIVIAQNGDAFDIKKLNTRFMQYGLTPPSPYKTIDTLKIARKFSFNSNKLDDLGRDLGLGRKLEHEGFPLWLKCREGDMKAWKRMKSYNKQDVELLEQLYLKERPWIKNHPNLDAFNHINTTCPRCGSKDIQWRGEYKTQTNLYKRFCCKNCGSWGKLNKSEGKLSYVSGI